MPSLRHTLPALLLLPASISAVTLDCKHIRVDKKDFDLSALGGPKSVHWQQRTPPSITNTTFTVDLCDPLKRTKGVPNEEQCPTGTRVCGLKEKYNPIDDVKFLDEVIPIAGEFSASHGRGLEPKIARLKESSNTEQEGLRIELNGGKYPFEKAGVYQRAIIELHCDSELSGSEGFEDDEKMMDIGSSGAMRRRDDDDDEDEDEPELPDLDKDKSLQFVSYKVEKDDIKVLRLTWKTKYACENAEKAPSKDKDGEKSRSSSWGFFTWFIIILFLLAAVYIIFGSWLNYNRYGARGWDLIPHGDTIRDIPYIVKEWAGDMVERMKGSGGSRGGYSAV